MRKKSQQEIVGFVLIVALVVVGIMVFMIISLKKPAETKDSAYAENLLNVLMKQTTDCAIVYEPDYDNIGDLIKSCYLNYKCKNLDKMACDYLNETLTETLDNLMKSESTIAGYSFDIYYENQSFFHVLKGSCRGNILGAMTKQKELSMQIKLCS